MEQKSSILTVVGSVIAILCFFISALFGQQNIIINGDLETVEPFFWHPMNAGDGNSVLNWTEQEAYQEFRSFQIFKPNSSSAAVGWISENNAQAYYNSMTDDITYDFWCYIKTSGVNINPTTNDERIGLLYKFFDASKALIAEEFLPADQSVPDRDWHEVSSSVYIPPGSVPDSMICIAQFGKDATGTAWFEVYLVSNPWSAWMFGGDAETPQGWMYWTASWSPAVAMYDNSEAHSGTYSAKLEENDLDSDEIVFYSIPVPVVPENYYHISAWIKTQGVNTDSSFTPTCVITDRLDERMGICFFFHEPPIETSWILVPPGDLYFYIDQTVDSHDWRKYEAIWKAPAGAAGVSMRAIFKEFPTGTAWFDDFSIREVLNDSIIVIFPNGGEMFPVGYDYNITWTSTQSISDVKIEYSTDGGTDWSTIVASTLNDGSYTWTMPNTPSTNCFVRISDAIDNEPSDVSNSKFIIGFKGDVNGDGVVDIFDLVKLINFILDKAEPTPYEFWAGDINDDGELDIFDVVKMIKIILGGDITTLAKMAVSPAQIGELTLPNVELVPEQTTEIPVYANFNGTVAGIQLEFRYDPQALKISAPVLTSRTDQMDLASADKDGKLTVLIYSASGNVIEADSEPIVKLRVETLSGFNRATRLEVDNAIAVNGKAEDISVDFSLGNIVAAKPKIYFLFQNYPNPFNTQTMIKYQLPQSDRVVLKIYNNLGQEIRTLVDEEKKAGYYSINWDGRDDEGLQVSSGIYIYRIKSGDYMMIKKMLFVM